MRYEKLVTPLAVKLLRFFGFVAASFVTAFLIVAVAFRYIDSPKTIVLESENEDLKNNYSIMQQQLNQLQKKMSELEKRDNTVYRTIFESAPVPDSARLKAIAKTKEETVIQSLSESQLLTGIAAQLNSLQRRVAYQERSYKEIDEMINNKEKLLAAIPAIQPVSNKDLTRIASGFGTRIDPVYKVNKFHAGLDFTAPQGTPIYATADGVVKESEYNTGGYGNMVVINHGFGYETLYGHMYKIKTKRGSKVVRGQVIGYIGNTGKSTGPHCHYEVHRNGVPVDPIYYFYNDLTPEQYEVLLKLAEAPNQSLD